jgi:hypothetical protein
MIRIASPSPQGKRKAAPVEDASTWPTNRPPGTTGKAAKPAKPEKAGQGARRGIYAAPVSLKHHGTPKREESIADETITRTDPTLLTTRFALLALVSAVSDVANDMANNMANKPVLARPARVANKRSVSQSRPVRRKAAKGKASHALLTVDEKGDVEASCLLDSISQAKQPPKRRRGTYMRDLMARRRAAQKLATVIL